MRDMGPILTELKQLREENEQLKKMLKDTYGFGWTMEFDRRELARKESIKIKGESDDQCLPQVEIT